MARIIKLISRTSRKRLSARLYRQIRSSNDECFLCLSFPQSLMRKTCPVVNKLGQKVLNVNKNVIFLYNLKNGGCINISQCVRGKQRTAGYISQFHHYEGVIYILFILKYTSHIVNMDRAKILNNIFFILMTMYD